jgi:hypothetical protein
VPERRFVFDNIFTINQLNCFKMLLVAKCRVLPKGSQVLIDKKLSDRATLDWIDVKVRRTPRTYILMAIGRKRMRRLIAVLGLLLLSAPLYSATGRAVLEHRGEAFNRPDASSAISAALTIPAETLVKARLISGMHTLVSHVNDPVSAEMTEPVFINGQMALPKGTLFDGYITSVHRPSWMRHNGEIAFRFDHVTLPDGHEVPVSAIITHLDKNRDLMGALDSEGHVRGHRRGSWRSFLTGAVGVGGLTAVRVVVASSTALTVAAPASAAAFVGYELFLRRGSNVNVPPMTGCRIRLLSSLTIPGLV